MARDSATRSANGDHTREMLQQLIGDRPVVLIGMMGAGKTTVGRRLAALAPKLSSLAAEVEYRQFAFGVELAKVTPFAGAALRGFLSGGMKRRVAQGDIKAIFGADNALKNMRAVVLLA